MAEQASPGSGSRSVPARVARGPAGWPGVVLVEEGMREGLQIEDSRIPLDQKVRLLDALSRTGLSRIVVGSFVSPRWTPQMADIDELVERFTPSPDVVYTALALNQRGVERRSAFVPPLSTDGAVPATLVHLCDVFVQRNTNRTREQEIASWPDVVARAVADQAREAQIGVNSAWGSNWLGLFSHDERMGMLQRQYELWASAGIAVTKVFLGDPMGWHMPDQVEQDLRAIQQRWPSITTFHLHLHNTRGIAPISSYTALRNLDEGHTLILDAAIGGMGGCPYCGNGRAAGLIPTEDLVYLLEELGYATGVDLAELVEVVALAEQIVGHSLYGHVSKAGGRPRGEELYAMDMPFVETLEQAQHFRSGPAAYAGALSPWTAPIRSTYRPEADTPPGTAGTDTPTTPGRPA